MIISQKLSLKIGAEDERVDFWLAFNGGVLQPRGYFILLCVVFGRRWEARMNEEKLFKEFLEWKTNQSHVKQIYEMLSMLDTRMVTVNERTKNHTFDLQELRREIKKLKEHKSK